MNSKHFDRVITPQDAIYKVHSNVGSKTRWFPVQNKTGSIFEIAGCVENGKLKIQASIPPYDKDGMPEVYSLNGHTKTQHIFYLGYMFHPSDATSAGTLEKFTSMVKNKDFRKMQITSKCETMFVEEEICTKKIKFTK